MKELENKYDYPDGYYLISNKDEPEKSIVYLYTPNGFSDGRDEIQTTRHIAFNPIDGGAVMPIWDVKTGTSLKPIGVTFSTRPIKNEDLKLL